jgi:hypothetical protein
MFAIMERDAKKIIEMINASSQKLMIGSLFLILKFHSGSIIVYG